MDECVGVVREFSKEEVVMPETRRMAEEANRIGQEAQDRAQRMGHEFQNAAGQSFEAAGRSLSEVNRGFQAIAAEMTEYSKKAFNDAIRTWEQLIGVKSLEQAIQIQSDYAKRVYENHMAELSKLGEMCVGMVQAASKPVDESSRRFR
jgi:hypothetical protein